MKVIIFYFLIFIVSNCYSQTLWTVDTDNINKVKKYWKQETYEGESFYYKKNIGDFEIIVYKENSFAFQRNGPPAYMFEECYNYLAEKFGEPIKIKDYATTNQDLLKWSISAQVISGNRKYWRAWETETKFISIEWYGTFLQVLCCDKSIIK